MSKKIRLQFDMTEEQIKSLETLMKKVGVSTKKDLINNALSLLEWAVGEKGSGRSILSVDEEQKRYKELVMPVLNRAA